MAIRSLLSTSRKGRLNHAFLGTDTVRHLDIDVAACKKVKKAQDAAWQKVQHLFLAVLLMAETLPCNVEFIPGSPFWCRTLHSYLCGVKLRLFGKWVILVNVLVGIVKWDVLTAEVSNAALQL